MPGNVSAAAPVGVLPADLSTSFVEALSYPMLSNSYHDGTIERGLIADGINPPRALRSWRLARRLSVASILALLNLWENVTLGGLKPIYFYNPFDVVPPAHVGSNFDATGANPQGRVTVVFRGDWRHVLTAGSLSDAPDLMLVEVA